ncbi:MAG: UDPGP type 1 family protein [Deltaproteobacteria bacterium]|nr:UDPGP type 1 family protein [Deltaproteobacteria bacterium]MBW2362204.1 UDPGP type 1 family protein [Deltaproteobacteria bacterium]
MRGEVSARSSEFEALRARFAQRGQEHVFAFWKRLSASEQASLAAQCAELDLDALLAAFEATRRAASGPAAQLSPVEVEVHPGNGGDAERFAAAARRGTELLCRGEVAVLVVAGGQATRLGYPGPKGLFPIGPLSGRCLFEIQAQKLRRLRQRSGASVPWYVMTSPATDAATRAGFAAADHFGLPPEDVFFFVQGTVPSFDFDGRLILAEPGRLAENPDGHGGVVPALARSGALADMQRRGITALFHYQVDNPLVRMADAAFLGFHAERAADVSCKVVRKIDPDEKVGVLAQRDGKTTVVEYTEIGDEQCNARDAEGQLVYWAGNIAVHCFDVAFLAELAGQVGRTLPYHTSAKKISGIDADGHLLDPEAPNGYKLERFVFDALPAARRVASVEALRAEEFSPVKNARGCDSPETCRRDLNALYARWLRAAGIDVPAGAAIEIDHARVDCAEDLAETGLRDVNDADFILIETGART